MKRMPPPNRPNCLIRGERRRKTRDCICPTRWFLRPQIQSGRPSCRAVNLRKADEAGLVFYTNYESRKGRELADNPRAACLLIWYDLSRQIRVEGPVRRLSAEESDAYFATRERGATLEAWASRQSEVIPDRAWLEGRFREYEERFEDGAVSRPPHWGGYIVVPETFEFWQGRPNRMHDRLLYERKFRRGKVENLAPFTVTAPTESRLVQPPHPAVC